MEESIVAKAISKKYIITGTGRKNFTTLRDKIEANINGLYRRITTGAGLGSEEFWALRDINFVLKKGEVLGMIGKNGAGKSTLLKILSRITRPTGGEAVINGRVASLLEVGTGFHQELTGRENIYLNGAILGMTRAEIKRKFDEIVDFSGVERFLDTPVKKYSSGMHVRLAFSVAAHMETDVMLVDEVLAVGDVEFQKKCLGKMDEITKNSGRTILFVSHDLGAVRSLCDRCILLEQGRIVKEGNPKDVINSYVHNNQEVKAVSLAERTDRIGSGRIKLVGFYGEDETGKRTNCFLSGQPALLKFNYEAGDIDAKDNIYIYIGISALGGEKILTLSNKFTRDSIKIKKGRGVIMLRLPRLALIRGDYVLDTTVKINDKSADSIFNIGRISVEPGGFYKNENQELTKMDRGHVMLDHNWSND